ncbi:MAG: hypothetical protein ACREXX_00810 [Gammaproteobacteria bacterium]
MKTNELLLWLSARREGSWQQFRAAVERLHADDEDDADAPATGDDGDFPLHQGLRLEFERLAHVEFFACGCGDGWRIAPPALASHSTPNGFRAVLCGARSAALVERLLAAAADGACETLTSSTAPDVIRLTASHEAQLAEVGTRAGVHFQTDAPFAILSHLPPCAPPSRKHTPSQFPLGAEWDIHEFDAFKLAWRKTDRRRAETASLGVFRFWVHFQRPRYFLRLRGVTYELPRAVALFLLLKRKRRDVLRYGVPTRSLSVPAICRPPRLLERALVLCSGLPPVFDPTSSHLIYEDVPLEIAQFTAELLRQALT